MVEVRELSNPPILEGLIDIRFSVADTLNLHDLRPVIEHFKESFPIYEERQSGTATIVFPTNAMEPLFDKKPPETSHLTRTDFEKPDDRKRLLIVQRDGLTVSHLKQYGGWEELSSMMHALFDAYVDVAKPIAVIRIGLRYINKISLPIEKFDFDDFFTCGPRVPPGLKDEVFDFASRIGIFDERSATIRGFITQSFAFEPTLARPSYIIDIDVFEPSFYSARWSDIAQTIDALRNLKNKAFFSSVTERTVSVFS